MIFSLDNYNFDIIYNSTDIIVQVEYEDKIYQDVFLLSDLEKQSSIFKNIKIVEKFLTKSLIINNNNYKYNIKLNKTLTIECVYSNDLEDIKLTLELLPIRKDISSNKEIISLKKMVKLLENKLEKYNLFFDKIYINPNINKPIYKDSKYILFSDVNFDNLYTTHWFNDYTHRNCLYNHLAWNPWDNSHHVHISLNNHKVNGDFLDEEFLQTFSNNLEVLIFVNLIINENILKYIPNIKYLNFIKCDIKDFTGLNTVENINLYECNINNIDNFKNYKQPLIINTNKNPTNFNQAILPSNVKYNLHSSCQNIISL